MYWNHWNTRIGRSLWIGQSLCITICIHTKHKPSSSLRSLLLFLSVIHYDIYTCIINYDIVWYYCCWTSGNDFPVLMLYTFTSFVVDTCIVCNIAISWHVYTWSEPHPYKIVAHELGAVSSPFSKKLRCVHVALILHNPLYYEVSIHFR